MYQRAAGSYRRGFLNHSLSQDLRDALLAAPDEAAVQQLLFPNFAQFALASFADEISAYRSADCNAPAAMLRCTKRAWNSGQLAVHSHGSEVRGRICCQSCHEAHHAVAQLNSVSASMTSRRSLVKTADLTNPHLWYPMARAIKRRVIYHAGPTNSGKTYQALQARAVR